MFGCTGVFLLAPTVPIQPNAVVAGLILALTIQTGWLLFTTLDLSRLAWPAAIARSLFDLFCVGAVLLWSGHNYIAAVMKVRVGQRCASPNGEL